jgi:hypothetical protein
MLATNLAIEVPAAACGLVLLITAVAVLKQCRRLEVSLRSLAALGIAAWGVWLIALPWLPASARLVDLLAPAAVVLWIVQAVRRRKGLPMRRISDWLPIDSLGALAALAMLPWILLFPS